MNKMEGEACVLVVSSEIQRVDERRTKRERERERERGEGLTNASFAPQLCRLCPFSSYCSLAKSGFVRSSLLQRAREEQSLTKTGHSRGEKTREERERGRERHSTESLNPPACGPKLTVKLIAPAEETQDSHKSLVYLAPSTLALSLILSFSHFSLGFFFSLVSTNCGVRQ